MQEQEGEERIVAKSKPTTMNQDFTVSTSSSTVQHPVASKTSGTLKALGRTKRSSTGKPDVKEHDQDAASSSQGRQKDAGLNGVTGKLVTTEEDQERLNYLEDSVGTVKLVGPEYPGSPGDSEAEDNDKVWPLHLHISPNYKTSMWTQLFGEYLSFFKLQFIFAIYQESTHEIFKTVISSDWEDDHGSDRNFWTDNDWLAAACVERETTLPSDRAVQFATAQTYSFLSQLWDISDEPVKAWESKIKSLLEARHLKDLDRIDGEHMKLEWTNFPGFTTLDMFDDIKKWWLNQCVSQSKSKEGSCSCQCTMTLIGDNEKIKKTRLRMPSELLSRLEDSREDIERLQDLDQRRNRMELMSTNLIGNGEKTTEDKKLNFVESGHPISVLSAH